MPRRLTRRESLRLSAIGLGAAVAGCSAPVWPGASENRDDPHTTPTTNEGGLVDDWQFDQSTRVNGNTPRNSTAMPQATSLSADVGLAVGGAKDVANYRDNLDEEYLPIPSDLSYEGLFYDYYFDTGGAGDCDSLFCPSYATAVTPDPLSGEREQYLTVGLDSGLDASTFERPALDLVVVLDISGSMGSSFAEYYYDRFGNRHEVEEHSDRPKIDIAAESLAALTTHLRDEDRFGVVLFNDESHVAKPIRRVSETDMEAIRGHIRDLRAEGGTQLSAGAETGMGLLEDYAGADPTERETRMLFLTDAMPNLGETRESSLLTRFESRAEQGVYTTFVGIGVDFNTELVDAVTAIEGANYFSVHSEQQFTERLDEEFEYMVTPLVFDLSLELDAEGYDIETVYGSTAAEEATGEIMHVNTLFPSPAQDGRTRGGIILVKLEEGSGAGSLSLHASWETRRGDARTNKTTIEFPNGESTVFETSGIRKGVLLARYADLMKNWMIYERQHTAGTNEQPTTTVSSDGGIEVPPEDGLGQWERQSTDLVVSPRYQERFDAFADYFASEMDAIGDDSLQQELDIIERLSTYDA